MLLQVQLRLSSLLSSHLCNKELRKKMFNEHFFPYILPINKYITFANAIDSPLALVRVLALGLSTRGITSVTASVLVSKRG